MTTVEAYLAIRTVAALFVATAELGRPLSECRTHNDLFIAIGEGGKKRVPFEQLAKRAEEIQAEVVNAEMGWNN